MLNQNVFGETYGHHYGVRRCRKIESSIKESIAEALEECLGNLTYQNKKIVVSVYLRQEWGSILFHSFSRGRSGLFQLP